MNVIAYHGSPNQFDVFDYKKIRTNGTSEGVGFYFTDNQGIARCYAYEGYLYTVEINGTKPIYKDKKTLTIKELRTFLIELQKHTDFLSNYGDVAYEGFNTVLNKAVKSEYTYCDSDADILSSIYNGSGENEKVLTIFRDVLGYDHIEAKPDWGNDQTLYIALTNDIINIISCEKL